jgi:cyanophycinase
MTYPKGFLVSIGGGEDKGDTPEERKKNNLGFFKQGILENIVKLMQAEAPRIEVITTASSVPDEYYEAYKDAFEKLGCAAVGHLNINSREMASDDTFLKRIGECDGIMFTGGDQFRLCSLLGGTPVFDLLKKRYLAEPFVVAGTSAGAAAMSNTMICGGDPAKAYFKGEVMLGLGLGFLSEVIIDTHFDKRGRFGRLAQAIASQPGAIGIGLGEDTGVIIEKGTRFKAIGSSSVIIIEGHNVGYNNIASVRDGMPISVSDLSVHIMAHSDVYDIQTRTFTGVKFEFHEN